MNMKDTKQILGFPIISISDGNKIGTVKSLIVNAEHRSVDFLGIQNEDWQVSERVVPYKKVIGVGDFAVTIENSNCIIDLSEIPTANDLATKKIKIIGSKVMTRKGELLGETIEYYIDEDNGKIMGLSINDAQAEFVLSIELVHTLGRDITVVDEEAKNQRLDRSEQLDPANQNTQSNTDIVEDILEDIVEEQPIVELNQEEEEEESDFLSFKEMQVDILKGKAVSKDIYNPMGELIVSKGTVLDRDTLIKIQEGYPAILVDLAMNIQ